MGTRQGEDWPESQKDAFPVLDFGEGQITMLGVGQNTTWFSRVSYMIKTKILPQDCGQFTTGYDGTIQYVIDIMWCCKFSHGRTTRINEIQLDNSQGALLYTSQHSSVPKSERLDCIFQFPWTPSCKLHCCLLKDTEMFPTTLTNENHNTLHSSFLLMQSQSHLVLLLS